MLYAMLALILWTFSVAGYLLTLRVKAVRSRQMPVGYYRVYTGAQPPARELAASRHYNNLFEMPLLFYVAGVAALALGHADSALLALAWCYVAARLVHSLIHLTYNHVGHRLAVFMLSNGFLLALWVLLVVRHASA